jgi:hypothetical protein
MEKYSFPSIVSWSDVKENLGGAFVVDAPNSSTNAQS